MFRSVAQVSDVLTKNLLPSIFTQLGCQWCQSLELHVILSQQHSPSLQFLACIGKHITYIYDGILQKRLMQKGGYVGTEKDL